MSISSTYEIPPFAPRFDQIALPLGEFLFRIPSLTLNDGMQLRWCRLPA